MSFDSKLNLYVCSVTFFFHIVYPTEQTTHFSDLFPVRIYYRELFDDFKIEFHFENSMFNHQNYGKESSFVYNFTQLLLNLSFYSCLMKKR